MDTEESNIRGDLIKIEELEMVLSKALLEGTQTVKHYLDLGRAYYEYYRKTHQQQDLQSAITFYKSGLDNFPSEIEQQLVLLHDLGRALMHYCEEYHTLGHVEDAVTCYTQALHMCPPGHPARSEYLSNLALALQSRYQQLGGVEDLEKAIACYEEALTLCPPDHPDRKSSLNNLAVTLQRKCKQTGGMEDLERAITCHEQALELCPPGHPDRSTSLHNLADDLWTRYKQLGGMEDLEKAITYHEKALELCPPGHPLRSTSLNNMAATLQSRYQQLGGIEDMEKAITYHEEALELCPPGHPARALSLNNLGNSLDNRYHELGEIEDLEKAITCIEEALELRPPGHPERPISLNNLASTFERKYKQLHEIDDLEKAIICYEGALQLSPPGHPARGLSLNNLAITLKSRYWQLGAIVDLEKAIACHEESLELCPPGHPKRTLSLNNLAITLESRYKQLGAMEDLEKAIGCHEESLESCPPGHPHRSISLYNLADALQTRYEQLNNQQDLQKAIVCYEQAASSTSRLHDRLRGAKKWAIILHKHGFSSAIAAYSLALDLLQQHLALLPSIIFQQKLVEKHFSLSLDAAACAIGTGMPEIAVQFLEQGRSILWSKIQGYRQPFEYISQKAPQLAQEFQLVSKQLEYNATSAGVDFAHQRALSERWATLLEEIRMLDGFSDYLQATPFKTLQGASAKGPVIMVNISKFRSDAIILVSHSPPVVVPLHGASLNMLRQLVDQISNATIQSNPSNAIYKVLQQLWNVVVNPVVEQLVWSGVPEKSHIWWCPTSYLCALPLHAAGPYKKGFKNLPDLYISSYTPTLASLIRARSAMPRSQSIPTLLLISQPDDTIPHVFEEARVIDGLFHITSCSGHAADKQGVVELLQSHTWVHFACHGHLEAQPFKSWFQLHNGEHLTVLDLAKAQLPNAEFAFLSACHSAAGGVHRTLDESIHLAGALQCSGFRSVIGTLWAMIDDVGPSIAGEFYKYMFHNPGSVDLRVAAEALNIATRELRRQGVSVDRWINFIHIGA